MLAIVMVGLPARGKPILQEKSFATCHGEGFEPRF